MTYTIIEFDCIFHIFEFCIQVQWILDNRNYISMKMHFLKVLINIMFIL